MKPSPQDDVRAFYDASAEGYTQMMDAEILGPLYADLLRRLADRLTGLEGAVLDTSCGPGHMLERYRRDFDPQRPLMGGIFP